MFPYMQEKQWNEGNSGTILLSNLPTVLTWHHMILNGITWLSHDITWSSTTSHDPQWHHMILTWHHMILNDPQISTVDAFQGGEREVIVLSSVRTQHVGFIDSNRRTNVALTRAKRLATVTLSVLSRQAYFCNWQLTNHQWWAENCNNWHHETRKSVQVLS